jgi:hypothetical protein
MTAQELKDWLGVLALLISVGTVVYAWLTSKASANASHLREIEAEVEGHRARIQALEAELKHLPDRDTVTEMRLTITELKGAVGNLNASVATMSGSLRRIEDFLLAKAKG